MKPIQKLTLISFVLIVPYLALAFWLVEGREVVPVWARIALGTSFVAVLVVLMICRKAILPKHQHVASELSRQSGAIKLIFKVYVVGIPVVLVIILVEKRWEYIPALVVVVLLTLYLSKWLSAVRSQSSGEPSTKR